MFDSLSFPSLVLPAHFSPRFFIELHCLWLPVCWLPSVSPVSPRSSRIETLLIASLSFFLPPPRQRQLLRLK